MSLSLPTNESLSASLNDLLTPVSFLDLIVAYAFGEMYRHWDLYDFLHLNAPLVAGDPDYEEDLRVFESLYDELSSYRMFYAGSSSSDLYQLLYMPYNSYADFEPDWAVRTCGSSDCVIGDGGSSRSNFGSEWSVGFVNSQNLISDDIVI
ncbi:hypothetical protein FIE12Z_3376 [Fusarium flagelliforme]|uniref:Uncharacterized protein n=1 Tax=Fusarium flagelliforme TaxID=2675880 RepID=A0A395MWR1_9HYPO|nr:hypothetical protein FIE12Z_3376 [Fusarium flagelliforme]